MENTEASIEIVEVDGEVAPELTLYADWLTYEVVPGTPGDE
jgi:hypothetical protein